MREAAAANSSWSGTPSGTSAKPAPITTAPPHPRAPACSTTSGTPAAGIAITTASTGSGRSDRDGTHGRPSAEVRDGFTPQTDPAKPIASRFNSAWAP